MTRIDLTAYTPQDHDWLVERHRVLYGRDEGFDDSFPALVSAVLRLFEAEHDPERERGWIARAGAQRMGSIFCCDGGEGAARLRLFLLEPEARGQGLGARMLGELCTFARAAGYARIVLNTHESHRAACALYARSGFSRVSSTPVTSFGQPLVEQVWTRDL